MAKELLPGPCTAYINEIVLRPKEDVPSVSVVGWLTAALSPSVSVIVTLPETMTTTLPDTLATFPLTDTG